MVRAGLGDVIETAQDDILSFRSLSDYLRRALAASPFSEQSGEPS
jgi:hypothetical protein